MRLKVDTGILYCDIFHTRLCFVIIFVWLDKPDDTSRSEKNSNVKMLHGKTSLSAFKLLPLVLHTLSYAF